MAGGPPGRGLRGAGSGGSALEGEDPGAGLTRPVQAPATQRLEELVEPGPFGGLDAVHDLRRNLVVDGPADQAVGLEFAQLLGEHLLGDGGDEAPQLAGPAGTLQEVEEYDELPLASDDADRHDDGALVGGLPGHRGLHGHQKVRTGCGGWLLILCPHDATDRPPPPRDAGRFPAAGIVRARPAARLRTMNTTAAGHDTAALEFPVRGQRV